jgi:dTDP-4-dehydrorhamnose reductase
VIINAAGWTDVDGAELDPCGAYAVNSVGSLNLAVAAKAVGAVFAQISTDYVFSGVSESPWNEDDLCMPVSVYGTTKAAGEVAVLSEYAERSYIFRTAWLYSQWGKNFAKTMTHLALSGDGEVRVVKDQVGQPTSAMDLAAQIVDSVLVGLPCGIYHATNSGQGSWFDFASKVFEFSGASVSRLVPVSSIEFVRPAKRPAYSVLGHKGWREIEPMRDWRIALNDAMPAIVEAVREDLARN